MKPKKFISLLLALSLCLGMTLTARAAGPTLTVETPATLPAVGQTFTVTVDLAGNPGLGAVQFTLGFDKSVVECTRISMGAVLNGATLGGTNPAAKSGAKLAAVTTDAFSGSGEVAVCTFRVVGSGDADFGLKDVILSKPDGTNLNPAVHITSPSGGSQSGTTTPPPARPEDPAEEEESPAPGGQEAPETTLPEEETAAPAAPTFRDVPAAYWASSHIERAASLGIISGYADGSFRPGNSVTRAQFVTMLWRMAGKPGSTAAAPFADTVNLNADFRAAIAWASEHGYVNGVTATSFKPNATITRQQAMAILFRYNGSVSGMELMLTDVYDSQFTDSASIGAFAKPGVYWAVYNGVVTGTTATTITPGGTATRAQIAVILLRYMDKFQ